MIGIPARSIPGFPGCQADPRGFITLKGCRVRENVRGGGYHSVSICHITDGQKTVPVHRLVALAYFGEPPPGKRLVRHLDGQPWNNTPFNLKWGSDRENNADTFKHSLTRLHPQDNAIRREQRYNKAANTIESQRVPSSVVRNSRW